jgi:hypothetical protein
MIQRKKISQKSIVIVRKVSEDSTLMKQEWKAAKEKSLLHIKRAVRH